MTKCRHCQIDETKNGRLCPWCRQFLHRHGVLPTAYRIECREQDRMADDWARLGGSDKSMSVKSFPVDPHALVYLVEACDDDL